MKTSENIDKLAKALGEFQKDMPKLSRSREVKVKTKSGGTYGFKYTPLEQILEEVLPRLADYGLSISQFPAENASVTNILMHDSGQYISEKASFDISTNNPQDLGGVITYLRRYSLAGMIGLITDEDDDANKASGNTIEKQKDKEQKTRPKKPESKESATPEIEEGDEIAEKINSFDDVNDVVEFFNEKRNELEGEEKDEFAQKYGPIANKRVNELQE